MGKPVCLSIFECSPCDANKKWSIGCFSCGLGVPWNPLNEQNAHNIFSPNFLTFPTFPAKLNAKMGFFAKTKFAELIVYKKATFWALTGPKWTKIKEVIAKNVRHIV